MKTTIDYTPFAEAYQKRPDYADTAIAQLMELTKTQSGATVCDVGAGDGHLTRLLAARGLLVHAVEPNDAMRENGMRATSTYPNVRWHEGTGESTGLPSHRFHLVTFGGSFTLMDRPQALRETRRLLSSDGFLACLWNHRDLSDPLQAQIESIICHYVPGYDYAARCEDQTPLIESSGLFTRVTSFSGKVVHHRSVDDILTDWRSHGTIQRQAGNRFDLILKEMEHLLRSTGEQSLTIPYTTDGLVAKAM